MMYYSPLFLSEKPKNGRIKIHGGTLFDYYFVIDRKWNGKQRTNFITQQYLEGLLALIEEYKNDKHMKIRGTSYIINERTAEKMGFKIMQTDFLQKTILLYNYFNVLISNSIAKNKLAFPNLNKTKTFEADISQILEKKEFIEKLNKSLKNTIANSMNL
ncbi:hypothetical protein ACFSSB_02900 [Lacinutrix gracilariae]|uniref:Uncharacterized protein n=1 Tax=Lacinutrix gracilariae TaxID=1747198 RepID=A0ABW5JZI5_9FLAO